MMSPALPFLLMAVCWRRGVEDDTIKLWRVSDGALVRTLTGHTYDVYSVAFSPDGSLLASGSGDDTIKLWRVSDGALVRTLTGHTWYGSPALPFLLMAV
jgi:WD40 repeat protein